MYGSDSITLTNGESETVPTLQKQEREAIVPSIRTPMQRSSKTRSRKHEPHSGKHQGTPAPATPPDLAAASRRGAGDRKKTFNEGQKKGNHSKSKPNEDSRTGKRLKWNECIGEAEQQSGDAESVDENVLRDEQEVAWTWRLAGDSGGPDGAERLQEGRKARHREPRGGCQGSPPTGLGATHGNEESFPQDGAAGLEIHVEEWITWTSSK